MTTYREYLAQIAELQKKAEAARSAELSAVIADIKAKIAEHGLSAADLGLAGGARRRGAEPKPAAAPTGKVAPKYRGPAGELWTGRGRKPAWVVKALAAGKALTEYEIR